MSIQPNCHGLDNCHSQMDCSADEVSSIGFDFDLDADSRTHLLSERGLFEKKSTASYDPATGTVALKQLDCTWNQGTLFDRSASHVDGTSDGASGLDFFAPLHTQTSTIPSDVTTTEWEQYARQRKAFERAVRHLSECQLSEGSDSHPSATSHKYIDAEELATYETMVTATLSALDQTVTRLLDHLTSQPSAHASTTSFRTKCDDSDSSWADYDEDDDFYRDLYSRLRTFHEDKARTLMVTKPLYRRTRRHSHAIAHFMQMGHMTVSVRDGYCLLLSRDRSLFPKGMRKRFKQVERLQDSTSMPRPAPTQSYFLFPFDLDRTTGYLSSTSNHSSTSQQSNASSSTSGRKRQRQPRNESSFRCDFLDCAKVFHRQCDLNHHRRTHRAKDELPYRCPDCEQAFNFPKDLKRHQWTHDRESDTA